MASAAPTTPDTLVTLKVNYDGSTRRFKLPLRDLGASTLEDKLRGFLMISPGTECTFERYSDSAASYVVLDPANVSVYKQLYRAAKAKQKLKLRVTTKEEAKEPEIKTGPRPASVEDEPEPEPEVSQPSPETLIKFDEPVITPTPSAVPAPAPASSSLPPPDSAERLSDHINLAKRSQKLMEQNLKMIEATVAKLQGDAAKDMRERIRARILAQRAEWDAQMSQRVPPSPLFVRDAITTAPAVPDVPAAESLSSENEIGSLPVRSNFTVYCNSCTKTIPNAHYHCTACDDGDFDLCQDCVDKGITCYETNHWLIKRSFKNGAIVSSTTERIAPKPKVPAPVEESPAPAPEPEPRPAAERVAIPAFRNYSWTNLRTCNCCVQELPEPEFVHCTECDDYDLCQSCFVKDQHGHHPKHAFVPAVPGSIVGDDVKRRLESGRDQTHSAICDGCDKCIVGVRHKCLDCPDWDYCNDCVVNAGFIHANHRFVPIYEPISIASPRILTPRHVHRGICCDGPLCSPAAGAGRAGSKYIVGIRYKCAICHDTDFCANCEASPANNHNKTHPLIKFKTPVRHVSVTTTGERRDGQTLPVMGDNIGRNRQSTISLATETTVAAEQPQLATNVQTVVDVKPSEPAAVGNVKVKVMEVKEIKEEKVETPTPSSPAPEPTPVPEDLCAVYVKDTVSDGTIMPPDHVFEQTWILRNSGNIPWPAGCAVKYVGGDYMGHVNQSHPVALQTLVSASESTICYEALAPGQSSAFTVLLRTPPREGKFISYWRLTTKDGVKFGHRLWCDVEVQIPRLSAEETETLLKEATPLTKEENVDSTISIPLIAAAREVQVNDITAKSETEGSQMIFPKLEKESPVASVHEEDMLKTSYVPEAHDDTEEFEECDEDDEWAEESDNGIITDEEYDILDASDEEYLEEQQKLLKK